MVQLVGKGFRQSAIDEEEENHSKYLHVTTNSILSLRVTTNSILSLR